MVDYVCMFCHFYAIFLQTQFLRTQTDGSSVFETVLWKHYTHNLIHSINAEIIDAVKGRKGIKQCKKGLKARKTNFFSGDGKLEKGHYLQQERDANSSRNGFKLVSSLPDHAYLSLS